MTSEPTWVPLTDPLLPSQNSALTVIDYQPSQLDAVNSMDHDLLTRNIVSVARLAKLYHLPVVLSTVNVVANNQPPTLSELREVPSNSEEIDRHCAGGALAGEALRSSASQSPTRRRAHDA
jgi:nicotinamidase-related amidase